VIGRVAHGSPLAPAVVSDLTPHVVGMATGRQFRAFLAAHPQIPRHDFARHVFARVDHVLAAMGLGDVEPARGEEPSWDRDRVIALAARRGSK
jgi:hypothetical protein